MASRYKIASRSGCACYFENQSNLSGCNKNNDQNRQFSSGVADMVSTKKWLQANGLRRQKLNLFHLLPKIGFKLSDDYDQSLKKPVSSRYANGLFPQVFRSDGHTFNIVCCKEKLEQVAKRLQNIATHLKERLHWLTSGSRRIFGVIQEKRICIVVASTTNLEPSFEMLKKAIQIIVEEQVSRLEAFNIIFATLDSYAFHKKSVHITHDTVHKIIEWIKNVSLPLLQSSTSVCEAVLKALEDKKLEAVYLLCEGAAVSSCQELLRNKVLQAGKNIPVHINTFNCNDKELLAFLKKFAQEAGGRFHAYETYKEPTGSSSCDNNDTTLYPAEALFSKRNDGKETSVASREDVVQLFAELEEARNTLRKIQQLIGLVPERQNEIDIESSEMIEVEEENCPNEDYMSSKEWLSRYGIDVHGLEIRCLLEGVAFRHQDGLMDLLVPPRYPDIRTSAACKECYVSAKYCEGFPAIKLKSGQTVHVNMTPQVQRDYEERMLTVLNAVQQRLNWLKKGSRSVFGTVLEDEVYLLIDVSSSMEPKIQSVLELIECLLQEQLQHKKKINIVTFSRRASTWKERLTEVTPKNILDAFEWLKRQPCGGSTNTYAALRIALADPNTQGIYLLTDGRPDQPCKAILAQVQMNPSVPIHTISFNCNDEEANYFLYQLASSTHGRYHYYTDNDYNVQPPESWKCEDLRLLEEELGRGYRNLATVSSLREKCLMSLWKGEIKRLKSCSCKSEMFGKSWSPSPKDIDRSQSSCSIRWKESRPAFSMRQRQRFLPQWPFVPSCCKRKQHGPITKMSNQHLHAASTKTSRLRHRIALKRAMSSLRETESSNEEVLEEQGNSELTENEETMDERKVMLTENDDYVEKYEDNKKLSATKHWLKRNKLTAKRLTIMDALSQTHIPQKATYVPSINKYVLSKVFDDVFPLAHVMRDKNMQMTLVNPKGVNLPAYEKKLQKAIKSYMSFLDKIIWKALSDSTKRRLGSEVPLSFFKNKARLLAALRENNWPVAAEDVALLEREIEQGFKYLQMSHDLQKSELSLQENDQEF